MARAEGGSEQKYLRHKPARAMTLKSYKHFPRSPFLAPCPSRPLSLPLCPGPQLLSVEHLSQHTVSSSRQT